MKRIKKLSRATLAASALAIAALCCGCASLRALSSTPPIKAIVLDQTAEVTFGLGSKLTMPAGEYKPILEDKTGFYYQAPSKLAARDIFSRVTDGGLIVKRGERFPSQWYAIDNSNSIKRGALSKDFAAHVIE